MKRLFIMTGDASADQHVSRVVNYCQSHYPQLAIQAIGDTYLKATGIPIFEDHTHMRSMGVNFKALPFHWNLGRRLLHYFKTEWMPDAVLLVDYGMFHLKMAQYLKQMGIKVFYFIPPQVWASRKGRIKTIQKYVDHVFCIFPFELPLYESYHIPVTFVGHPLVEALPQKTSYIDFCNQNGLDGSRPLVGLFPGSRPLEITNLLIPMIQSLHLIQERSGQSFQFALAHSPAISNELLQKTLTPVQPIMKTYDVRILSGQNHAILANSQACLVASGTVTLEAALYQTPIVLSYKGSWIGWQLFQRLCLVPHIGLPNLLSDKPERIVPELWMHSVTAEGFANAVFPFLSDTEVRRNTVEALSQIKDRLGFAPTSQMVAQTLALLLDLNTTAQKTPLRSQDKVLLR